MLYIVFVTVPFCAFANKCETSNAATHARSVSPSIYASQLYLTCIHLFTIKSFVLFYGSENWAFSKVDVMQIYLLSQFSVQFRVRNILPRSKKKPFALSLATKLNLSIYLSVFDLRF